MTTMLLRLHTKVPHLKITSYLLLSKVIQPPQYFPNWTKKCASKHSCNEQKLQTLELSIWTESLLVPVGSSIFRLNLGIKRSWKPPTTSVKQFNSPILWGGDVFLILPKPLLSSWQTQQAVGLPSAEEWLSLASFSCIGWCVAHNQLQSC